jgi:hypothetical protein
MMENHLNGENFNLILERVKTRVKALEKEKKQSIKQLKKNFDHISAICLRNDESQWKTNNNSSCSANADEFINIDLYYNMECCPDNPVILNSLICASQSVFDFLTLFMISLKKIFSQN